MGLLDRSIRRALRDLDDGEIVVASLTGLEAEGRETTASGVTPAYRSRGRLRLPRPGDLRRWNLALTVLHLVQAVAVVVLASDFAITVTGSFPAGPPGTDVPPPEGCSTCRSARPSPRSSRSPRSTTC
jgi:hypothetical protein